MRARLSTVYPKKYAHGFVVLCLVVVMQSFIVNSHEVFIHIHQGCFAGTGAIVRLPQCQWSKPDGYGKISQCITTTNHSKAKTVCIFLGIYCNTFKFNKNHQSLLSLKSWVVCHLRCIKCSNQIWLLLIKSVMLKILPRVDIFSSIENEFWFNYDLNAVCHLCLICTLSCYIWRVVHRQTFIGTFDKRVWPGPSIFVTFPCLRSRPHNIDSYVQYFLICKCPDSGVATGIILQMLRERP